MGVNLVRNLQECQFSAPQIENCINEDYVVFNLIIDAEWEALRQHQMELKVDWMNTGKKNQSQDRRGLSRESNRPTPVATRGESFEIS